MHPGWRVTDHSAPGDRLLANVLWGSSGSTALVKDKQGSVCSILGVWVAVGILSLPIPGQPDLATSLEWKALSLSWLMTLPGCHLPGTFCGLVLLSRRYSAKTSQEREQLVEQVRTGAGKGCGLRAPVHSIPGARYKAADPPPYTHTKASPSFWYPAQDSPPIRPPLPEPTA